MLRWVLLSLVAAVAWGEVVEVPLEAARWTNSVPAPLRGDVPGAAATAEGGRPVLVAPVVFADPKAPEPIWLTTKLTPPVPRLAIRQVRFRYRFDFTEPVSAQAPLVVPGGFAVRLRTGPTSFVDHPVPAIGGGWPAGRWVEATVEAGVTSGKLVNIYKSLFEAADVQELTFRLQDVAEVNARGTLRIADLSLVVEREGGEAAYTPQVSQRPVNPHLRVLHLVHAADGLYGFERAARLVDPGAEVLTARFRGLHFPLWEYPATREAVLGYDLIVLGDVDPWVLTPEQTRWLADAVRSGAGLLVAAGPNSLGFAHRHLPALLDLLPVTYGTSDRTVAVNAEPAIAPGELIGGLTPSALGRVGTVVKVAPKPGATVALTAGGSPLLVTGRAGQGRVAVLTSWAQPGTVDDPGFGSNVGWPAFAGRLLAWLAAKPMPAPPPTLLTPPALRAYWRYGHSALEPGRPFTVQVFGAAGEVRAELCAGGRVVWTATAAPGTPAELSGILPDLSAGPAQVTVQAAGLTAKLDGRIVEPLRRADFYPIISYLPFGAAGHQPDTSLALATVDDLLAHGYNTVAVGAVDPAGNRHGAVVRGAALARAAAAGMATIREYSVVTLLRDKPYEVSPWDPAFKAALEQRAASTLDLCRSLPRLLSVKVVDEPSLPPSRLDTTPATEAAWAKYGTGPLPRTTPEAPGQRYAYARFLSAYLEQDFATAREALHDAGVPADLLVTYMSSGYGRAKPLSDLEDAWRWTRSVDRFDFDVYPYFYPVSDRCRFVLANWGFAASRTISRARRTPWGFYIELDDRNWPYQQNPAEASAECAHAAVAAGADYLNSFIHVLFATGSGARPERWAKMGEALNRIRRIGPLLTHWARPAARTVVLWPEAQQAVRNGTPMPEYALAVLGQALGGADVLPEELLAEGPPPGLDLVAMVGVDILRRDAAERLAAWVAHGGSLLLDRLPTTDEQGRPLAWPAGFETNPRVRRVAAGYEERCRQAVELSDEGWTKLLDEVERDLRPCLRGPGPDIRLLDNRLQGEVAVRRDGDSGLVVLVNHDGKPRETAARVGGWGFPVGWVVDLTTGRTVAERTAPDGSLTVRHLIAPRDAVYLGVYPARPKFAALTVSTPTVAPGGELRYRLALEPASGCHPVHLTVNAPDGRVYERFGGERATTAGVLEVSAPVPVDAPAGAWTIAADLPLAGTRETGRFEVRGGGQ